MLLLFLNTACIAWFSIYKVMHVYHRKFWYYKIYRNICKPTSKNFHQVVWNKFEVMCVHIVNINLWLHLCHVDRKRKAHISDSVTMKLKPVSYIFTPCPTSLQNLPPVLSLTTFQHKDMAWSAWFMDPLLDNQGFFSISLLQLLYGQMYEISRRNVRNTFFVFNNIAKLLFWKLNQSPFYLPTVKKPSDSHPH